MLVTDPGQALPPDPSHVRRPGPGPRPLPRHPTEPVSLRLHALAAGRDKLLPVTWHGRGESARKA
ncbi:hypothetical protein [Streptomyces sp. NPDC059460]|uniref:hypothetical protein n=1 Tax=Streptomyces sp. NPDC059460 TaxID=3346840 RepID=UPI0036A14A00